MDIDIGYFRAIQNATNKTTYKEVAVAEAKRELARELIDSPGYEANALRNGKVQPLIITAADTHDRCNVFAMPNDELVAGDMIEVFGEMFIVTVVNAVDTFQTYGTMLRCNHLFKFQLSDGTLVERWGVLDSGVYATTLRGDENMTIPDKQYKIYLPYDELTSRLYIDIRFATEQAHNAEGEDILICYRITGYDSVSDSFGKGKLLVCNARSDMYDPYRDSYELCICDYIPVEKGEPNEDTYCQIIGSDTLIVGGAVRKYTAEFFNKGVLTTSPIPYWNVVIPPECVDNVHYVWDETDGTLSLESTGNADVVGKTVLVTLTDSNASYGRASKIVRLVSFV